jgi:TolA-binding protein
MRISSPRASASVFEAPLPSRPVSDAALEFRAAVGALEAGDNAVAAARFAAFLAAYPGDSRAEDAAYLRVIALQRLGNAVRVREAARQYLHRYPRGFRRAEVEALTR